MQYRAENLVPQFRQARDLDDRRRHEGAVRAIGGKRQPEYRLAARVHIVDVAQQLLPRLRIDDRPDIDRQPVGRADRQFPQRAFQHAQRPVGDVLLEAEHAQGRAALAGAIECRHDDVLHHLLRQRAGIDDHGILAAGLGDQDAVFGVIARLGGGALGECAADALRDLGRTGEHHAAHARVRHQRRAHYFAAPGQELQCGARHPRLMHQLYRPAGDQRRLLRRFGQHHITGGKRGADLADEYRQRKIPGADADHRSQRFRGRRLRAYARRVIAQEIDRLAHFGGGVLQRLARFPDRQRHQLMPVRFEQIRGAFKRLRAPGGGRPVPRGGMGACGGQGRLDVLVAGFDRVADHIAMVGGIAHGPRRARSAGAARQQRPRHPLPQAETAESGVDLMQGVFIGEVDAR
jgi:hypothetical protein